MKYKRLKTLGGRVIWLFVFMTVLATFPALAEDVKEDVTENAEEPSSEAVIDDSDWVTFLLQCNEGMSNRGGNSGNTIMVISMNERTGAIRMMPITWDTFVDYPGYDLPQKLDMAYRNGGPEETLRLFDTNFQIDIELFMSLNFLNLASLVDSYGGVVADVSRQERNALNTLVEAKKEDIYALKESNLLDQLAMELLAKEYYLAEFGQDTRLNGLQAVAYGWLQYDSVYSCCEREAEIVRNLFKSVVSTIKEDVAFYTNETNRPELPDDRRIINLDEMSQDDMDFLLREIHPIIQMSYNNLTQDNIVSIVLTFARAAYYAARQGINILDQIEFAVFPLEINDPYDNVAGTLGHLVNFEENSRRMKEFLYGDDEMVKRPGRVAVENSP